MVLKDKRCYLSGPIEHDTSGLDWRVDPSKILREEFGIDLHDPYCDPKQQWAPRLKEAQQKKDYETMTSIAKSFVRKDLTMVDHADFVIAYLPYRVPTCGTHHEIITSNNEKKPTLLVCPQGKEYVPLWYYGFIPHEFMFGCWEGLYGYLREVNGGLHKHNDRWAFVYGLV